MKELPPAPPRQRFVCRRGITRVFRRGAAVDLGADLVLTMRLSDIWLRALMASEKTEGIRSPPLPRRSRMYNLCYRRVLLVRFPAVCRLCW